MNSISPKLTLAPDAAVTEDLAGKARELRKRCVGETPLDARLETWQVHAMLQPELPTWVEKHGSPLNLINAAPLVRNISELERVAADRGLDFRVFFARKANKCLAFADAAKAAAAGIDVASLEELNQVLDRGWCGRDVICTAAVKGKTLLSKCLVNEVTVALDNDDEMQLLARIAAAADRPASVALRISGFHHDGEKLHSRFGFDIDSIDQTLRRLLESSDLHRIHVVGLHFHLDGYSASQRADAVRQCLPIIDRLRENGQRIEFLDIGGGLPMSYLENQTQWQTFWAEHERALLGQREPLTYRNHGLGLMEIEGRLHGKRNCYPYFQSPIRADWLAGLLDAPAQSLTIADAIRDRKLQLRCEPGRSVLDGCGMTVAEVQLRKQHHNGDWFVGLSMNRTQCRTSSDDFLVDPIVIPNGRRAGRNAESMEGFLVGAYCTESELLLLRKLRFPQGVQVGDLVVFPNTAGYLMHFLESRSHQFPLAKNLVVTKDATVALDAIDC